MFQEVIRNMQFFISESSSVTRHAAKIFWLGAVLFMRNFYATPIIKTFVWYKWMVCTSETAQKELIFLWFALQSKTDISSINSNFVFLL